MKKIILTAFIAAGMLFTSCNDDDNTTPDNGTKVYLPVKMSGEDGSSVLFSYDNKGKVTSIVDSDDYKCTFTYSGDKLVKFSEISDSIETVYTFSQEGNTITLNSSYEYNGQTYDNTGTIEVDENGNLLSDGLFSYTYDEAGNNVKIAVEDKFEGGSTATMTFDTKNGFTKNLSLPKWLLNFLGYGTNAVNNMLTFDSVSEEYPEDNNSSVMSYEYNEAGYPIKMKVIGTDTSGTEEHTVTIEYTKK